MSTITETKTLKNFIGGQWVDSLSGKTEVVPNFKKIPPSVKERGTFFCYRSKKV
jgi:hypothetical protein